MYLYPIYACTYILYMLKCRSNFWVLFIMIMNMEHSLWSKVVEHISGWVLQQLNSSPTTEFIFKSWVHLQQLSLYITVFLTSNNNVLLFQDYCTCTLDSELNVLHEDSEDAEDFESYEDEFSDEGIIIDISSSEDEDINNNL